MKAGKTDFARDTASIDAHMKNKLTEDQRKAFKKCLDQLRLCYQLFKNQALGLQNS